MYQGAVDSNTKTKHLHGFYTHGEVINFVSYGFPAMGELIVHILPNKMYVQQFNGFNSCINPRFIVNIFTTELITYVLVDAFHFKFYLP